MMECEQGIPSGLVYRGLRAWLKDVSDRSHVTFRLASYGEREFWVDWDNVGSMWKNCSLPLQANGEGRLFLSLGWMQGQNPPVVAGADDPKIPEAQPGVPKLYFRVPVEVVAIQLQYRVRDGDPAVHTSHLLEPTRTLPRWAEPNQVALDEYAEGDLWLTEYELSRLGRGDLMSGDRRTWPDPEDAVQALADAGVLAVEADGSVRYAPTCERDIHQLSHLLSALTSQQRSLPDVLRSCAAKVPARGPAPRDTPGKRRKPR